ncbi:hypothetical protein EVB78_008 [Rhizobium phage RHph_N1_15]|nr:hypothetical protein EVB77_008 [Rhizobium phage RHph_N1_10]QIG69210.1 hypothetical protein EVB78_008 [Rhizobium phage RHph_N1_15]QIG75070.1 hypothetical protein EVC15_008 [Rhizobium phage RHph_N2_6]
MKKFLKFKFTYWATSGEASGRLEVWLLFIMFLVVRLGPWMIAAGAGLHYLQQPSQLFWQA